MLSGALTSQLPSDFYLQSSCLSGSGIQRDVGLAGRAAVSIISVTCPAWQPAVPPVIRLEFIWGQKILDPICAVHRSPSLSLLTNCSPYSSLSVSQVGPKLSELVCKSPLLIFSLRNCEIASVFFTSLFQFARVKSWVNSPKTLK